ncbi:MULTISPECIES: flagellar brake protein [Pseudoxanthomonas]|uniref:flagellar brake protein n=1 Tax=Pseudoxanthomonas TaxID=83618 RepID=UPI001613296B|nr:MULTISPECIES: flagellar brake protein [Pseudoxanthomonas]MBB3274592.1 c-di-GMP-binding flagellar brake protein YcgR [Pseudoxanthomonas sp. OG2]
MSEQIEAATQEPVRYDEEEKYLLRHPRDIRQVLQALIDRRALISAHLVPRGHVFPTALIELAADEGSLLFDGSISETINRAVEEAAQIICVSQLDRVHVQFPLTDCERLRVDGQTAFRAPLPERVLRLQRREFYRLQVPVSYPVRCLIPFAAGEEEPQWVEMRVLDISGGGLAVEVPPERPEFRPFREYTDCRLLLPDGEPLQVRLMVKNLFRQSRPNGREIWRAGCQFTDLPRGGDAQIQRYIFRMERQRSARERGIG